MADSHFDMLEHFGALDELIQLIYQGTNKFVLLSAVDSSRWTVHLGLTGSERWWRGVWSERDVFKFLVCIWSRACGMECTDGTREPATYRQSWLKHLRNVLQTTS